jgi:hypothetical protein
MAGATEPCAPRTYRVGPWRVATHRVFAGRVVAALTIGVGALLPFAKAASWDSTPLPPPPVQQVPQQTSPQQTGPLQTSRLRPGDVVALQVIPYRE